MLNTIIGILLLLLGLGPLAIGFRLFPTAFAYSISIPLLLYQILALAGAAYAIYVLFPKQEPKEERVF